MTVQLVIFILHSMEGFLKFIIFFEICIKYFKKKTRPSNFYSTLKRNIKLNTDKLYVFIHIEHKKSIRAKVNFSKFS